jgi:hypothetical protein
MGNQSVTANNHGHSSHHDQQNNHHQSYYSIEYLNSNRQIDDFDTRYIPDTSHSRSIVVNNDGSDNNSSFDTDKASNNASSSFYENNDCYINNIVDKGKIFKEESKKNQNFYINSHSNSDIEGNKHKNKKRYSLLDLNQNSDYDLNSITATVTDESALSPGLLFLTRSVHF